MGDELQPVDALVILFFLLGKAVMQPWLHQKRKLKATMLAKNFNKAAVRKNQNHHPQVKRMLLIKCMPYALLCFGIEDNSVRG